MNSRETDGNTRWKIDNWLERCLGDLADKNELWKLLYVCFYRIFDHEYYTNGLKMIEQQITHFCGDNLKRKQKNAYIRDMVYSLHRFGAMFDEYFLFDFERLNVKGRNLYITDKLRFKYTTIP